MTDTLSDLMRSLRLRGAVFLQGRLTEPFAVNSLMTAGDCMPLLSRPAHLVAYHLVLDGRIHVSVAGESGIIVRAGEIVLLPRNDVHIVASTPDMAPVDARSLVERSPSGGLARMNHGGGGKAAQIFCGWLGCEYNHHPLIEALPRIMSIDVREATSRDLIEASLRFAANELLQGQLAESGVLSRLSELLLVEAIRRYADGLGPQHVGWLRGLKDPNVGRALALMMHQDIARQWTAETLAKEVAMSRSAFVERFTSLVGVPPIRYLTSWRMETAKLQLADTFKSVAQVGYSVGYDSEEAFSRAFKREIGQAPSLWRAQRPTS